MTGEPLAIDWSSAAVEDGTLTVALTGRAGRRWRARAEAVLVQLRHAGSGWEGVALERGGFVVHDVPEGREDEVRHFLEAVAMEANTALGVTADQRAGAEDDDAHEGDAADDADARMTGAFQAFGDEQSADSAEKGPAQQR